MCKDKGLNSGLERSPKLTWILGDMERIVKTQSLLASVLGVLAVEEEAGKTLDPIRRPPTAPRALTSCPSVRPTRRRIPDSSHRTPAS